MNLYVEQLEKEGLARSRAVEFAEAMEVFHKALSKMDSRSIMILSQKSFATRIHDYARVEELATWNWKL